MVNKQQEKDNRTVMQVLVIVFVIAVFFVIRIAIFSSGDLTYEEVCSIEFGESWKYEYDDLFGKTCVEIDYISLEVVNRTSFNWTNEQILNKYCPNQNKFWDLRTWKSGCENWRDLIE